MKTYTIVIDEDQRIMLAAALGTLTLPVCDLDEERELFVDMLNDLPAAKASDPGIIHDFCHDLGRACDDSDMSPAGPVG